MARTKDPTIRNTRQQQILEAARTIFAKQGLADARMDDIALQSGLSKGTLYLYYKNKDDLIAGLLQVTFRDLLAHLQALLDVDAPAEERLRGVIQEMTAYMQQDASTLNIAYEFYAVAARQPAIREFLKAYFAEYRRVLAALFEQGIERGEYARFDTSQVAITLVALFEGFTLLWFTDPESAHLESIVPAAVEHFLAPLRHKGKHKGVVDE